jgi:hypothetical protein
VSGDGRRGGDDPLGELRPPMSPWPSSRPVLSTRSTGITQVELVESDDLVAS